MNRFFRVFRCLLLRLFWTIFVYMQRSCASIPPFTFWKYTIAVLANNQNINFPNATKLQLLRDYNPIKFSSQIQRSRAYGLFGLLKQTFAACLDCLPSPTNPNSLDWHYCLLTSLSQSQAFMETSYRRWTCLTYLDGIYQLLWPAQDSPCGISTSFYPYSSATRRRRVQVLLICLY